MPQKKFYMYTIFLVSIFDYNMFNFCMYRISIFLWHSRISDGSVVSFQKTAVAVLASLAVF